MTVDSMDLDTSEVLKFAVELGRVPGKSVAAVQAVTKLSAEKVAARMREDAEGHPTFPDFPSTINSGLRSFAGLAIEYEIGPDRDYKSIAKLGNILYFGTSEHAPVLNINVGIDAESPAWAEAVAAAAAGSFGDVGS